MTAFRLRRSDGGATLRGAYTLRGLDLVAVGDELDVRWAVRTVAGDTVDARWSVRTASGDQINLQWVTRAATGDLIDLRWIVLSLLSLDPHLVVTGAARARYQATLRTPRYQAGAVRARTRSIDLRRTP